MRIRQKSLGIFLLAISYTTSLYPQSRVQILRTSLVKRLSKVPKASKTPLPPVFLDQSLSSNATYESDSIFLGNVQQVFQSFDDSLSLIYHEYIHHILHKTQKFDVAIDSTGEIVQWFTDESFMYTPFPEEVAVYVMHFKKDILPRYPNYEEMSPLEKDKIIKQMERTFSQKQKEFFIYAPSNLAKEELFAYRQQLKGEKLGLFVLSENARQNLLMRIKQLKMTYKQRRSYEKKHKLLRSGGKKEGN